MCEGVAILSDTEELTMETNLPDCGTADAANASDAANVSQEDSNMKIVATHICLFVSFFQLLLQGF